MQFQHQERREGHYPTVCTKFGTVISCFRLQMYVEENGIHCMIGAGKEHDIFIALSPFTIPKG